MVGVVAGLFQRSSYEAVVVSFVLGCTHLVSGGSSIFFGLFRFSGRFADVASADAVPAAVVGEVVGVGLCHGVVLVHSDVVGLSCDIHKMTMRQTDFLSHFFTIIFKSHFPITFCSK